MESIVQPFLWVKGRPRSQIAPGIGKGLLIKLSLNVSPSGAVISGLSLSAGGTIGL